MFIPRRAGSRAAANQEAQCRHRRLNTLLELVANDGQIDVHRAASVLEVSTATIRRDLDHLAQQQLVTRTRGGAVAHNVSYDLPLRYKAARRRSEKERDVLRLAECLASGQRGILHRSMSDVKREEQP